MSRLGVTSWIRWTLPVIVLLGVWASGRLVAVHDGGWRASDGDDVAITSPCGFLSAQPSATCAEVVASRWGSFDVFVNGRRFLVPASLLGLIYFVFAGVWLVMAPPGANGSVWVDRGWRLLTATGLAASLFFTGVMFLTLESRCTACLTVHAINLVLFVMVWWLTSPRRVISGSIDVANPAATPARRVAFASPASQYGFRWFGSAWVMSLCAAGGVWLYFEAVSDARQEWRKAAAYKRAYERLREDPELVMREFLAQPQMPLSEPEVRPVADRANGPRVMLFMDFDCTACACFERAWRDVLQPAMGRAIPVEVRYLPRGFSEDTDANSSESVRAALAAEAARMQGGAKAFAHMKRLLFAHRRDPGGRDYAALAAHVGLDPDRFLRDMDTEAVLERIRRDVELARAWGVTTTPAVFVDGRRVPPLCLNSRAFWAGLVGLRSPAVARRGER